jgi:hypothetical protein
MVDGGRDSGTGDGFRVGTAIPPRMDHCRRCGGERRLIVDDGPPICRICLMAWVWLARAVSSGESIAEPNIGAMRHATPRRLGRLDERSKPF